MLRIMNLFVLFINVVVLILGQLPEDKVDFDLYRSWVFMLIYALAILIMTDILYAIFDAIYAMVAKKYNDSQKMFISCIAFVVSFILVDRFSKIQSISQFIELIK